jgi:DNA-binding NtrC family response regulator
MEKEGGRQRILLIDEQAGWLDFATRCLAGQGYRAEGFNSLIDGRQFLEAEHCDLVVVDSRLAECEHRTFKEIAKLQTERGGRIIAVFSIELTPRQAGPVFALGAHDCVDKVYENSQLLELVQRQLDRAPIDSIPSIRSAQEGRPKLLVVDDDRDWRKRLVNYLSDEVCDFFTADDLPSAIQMIKTQNFDVIVLDLRLIEDGRDYEGMDLMRSLQDHGQAPAAVIVSAHGTVQHLREGLALCSPLVYMEKQSFDPDTYRTIIRKLLSRTYGE